MRVVLVGTNVELEPLRALETVDPEQLSPEVLAAAYARISRSPDSVAELRNEARSNVAKARRSNSRIVFDMGHSSIAEHAVFNFDVEGVSRLANEALEQTRLASFTERSQRYVKIGSDYIVPNEWSLHLDKFQSRMSLLVSVYNNLVDDLLVLARRRLGREPDRSETAALDTASREDARYVLPMATCGQLGMTINARSLEATCRRLKGHVLEEVRSLGALLEEEALRIAPSLIRYTSPRPLPFAQAFVGAGKSPARTGELCAAADSDAALASAVGFMEGRALTLEEFSNWVDDYYAKAHAHDPAPRVFEFVDLTFEVVVSAACFGQLKRHRMASILAGPYDPELGVEIPPAVEEAGKSEVLLRAVEVGQDLSAAVAPEALAYVMCNCHRRLVRIKMNLRELYHFSRLRMDGHAQWEIRSLASRMACLARDAMPIGARYLCGKDTYAAR